jgi:hypothetical protein
MRHHQTSRPASARKSKTHTLSSKPPPHNEVYASSFAAHTLQRLGMTCATDLIGGFQARAALRKQSDYMACPHQGVIDDTQSNASDFLGVEFPDL